MIRHLKVFYLNAQDNNRNNHHISSYFKNNGAIIGGAAIREHRDALLLSFKNIENKGYHSLMV